MRARNGLVTQLGQGFRLVELIDGMGNVIVMGLTDEKW